MAFMSGENEAETKYMKYGLLLFLVILSLAIGLFNTWGAWVRTDGNHFWTGMVIGAEGMMLFMFGLAVLAATPLRIIAGFVLWFGLAWFCVQNGKFAVQEMFSEVYVEDPQTLRQQADILQAQIPAMEAAALKAENSRGDELSRVRRQIAELEEEQELMLVEVADPTAYNRQVQRAQQSLQAKGEYAGQLDGIYGPLTRQAMLSRGSDIGREVGILRRQESALNPAAAIGTEEININEISAVGVALTPAQKAAAAAAKLDEQADEIDALNKWGGNALWIVEAVRSLTLWALIMTMTAMKLTPSVIAQGIRNGLSFIVNLGHTKARAEPEEPPEPEKEMTDAQRRAQTAGRASATEKQRGKIPVGDTNPFEQLEEAG